VPIIKSAGVLHFGSELRPCYRCDMASMEEFFPNTSIVQISNQLVWKIFEISKLGTSIKLRTLARRPKFAVRMDPLFKCLGRDDAVSR
jgi:hypothetical protein